MSQSENLLSWKERLIPLTKELAVDGSVFVVPDEIALRLPTGSGAALPTIEALLGPLAQAQASGTFEIRLGLAADGGAGCSEQTRRAVEACDRLAKNLAMLERKFPVGFGSLADTIRSWRSKARSGEGSLP